MARRANSTPKKGSGLKLEMVATDALIANPRNPRKNDPAVASVAKSIETYGFNSPIITDDALNVAAGHTRLKAAQRLGMETVPVIRVPGLTGSKFTGYSIADNQTASLAMWHDEMLAEIVNELNAEDDFDLDSLGFHASEIDRMLATHGDGSEDDVPPVPTDPVTQPGDLWLLGDHRLLCGDATKEADVGRLCADNAPFIMVTDPPYGVDYDPKWRDDLNKKGLIQGGAGRKGLVSNDHQCKWGDAFSLSNSVIAYVWHGAWFSAEVAGEIAGAGYQIRSQIIWSKPAPAISRGHYHWQHEPCWYAVRKGMPAKWCGDRSQSTIWNISNRIQESEGKTDHGTQKPVECMARPIRNHGKHGDYVYDPFVGSGTTIIAANKHERRCLAIDIDPAYCDVTIERWQNLTGGKAKKVSD